MNPVYDNKSICKICGQLNKVEPKDMTNDIVSEAATICTKCGHEDYWSYGFYESKLENKGETNEKS